MPRYNAAFLGQLAQLVEQRIENPRVRGSIPRLATRFLNGSLSGGRFRFCCCAPRLASCAEISPIGRLALGKPLDSWF